MNIAEKQSVNSLSSPAEIHQDVSKPRGRGRPRKHLSTVVTKPQPVRQSAVVLPVSSGSGPEAVTVSQQHSASSLTVRPPAMVAARTGVVVDRSTEKAATMIEVRRAPVAATAKAMSVVSESELSGQRRLVVLKTHTGKTQPQQQQQQQQPVKIVTQDHLSKARLLATAVSSQDKVGLLATPVASVSRPPRQPASTSTVVIIRTSSSTLSTYTRPAAAFVRNSSGNVVMSVKNVSSPAVPLAMKAGSAGGVVPFRPQFAPVVKLPTTAAAAVARRASVHQGSAVAVVSPHTSTMLHDYWRLPATNGANNQTIQVTRFFTFTT